MRDTFAAYADEIAAIVERHDLAAEPVALHVRGMNGGLDYPDPDWAYAQGGLRFGTLYRATRPLCPNRRGRVDAGDEAYFLGYSTFPYEGGLRFYMECRDGGAFELEFHGDGPCAKGELSEMTQPLEYFEAVEDVTARAADLAQARASIEALAAAAKAERDTERQAARPAWEKHTEAAIATFDLPFLPAWGFVQGKPDTLDFAHLRFGELYRVAEGIASNRGGALTKGQTVRYLGASTGADKALGLFFETTTGEPVELWFVPDAPQAENSRRYFREPESHLRPVRFDFAKRRKQLVAARAVLLHIRTKQVEHG